jgi:hypothetical protein
MREHLQSQAASGTKGGELHRCGKHVIDVLRN